jgi:hypothetical protein
MAENDIRIEKLREQIKLPLVDMEMIERKNLLKNLLFDNLTKTKDKNDKNKCQEMDILAQDIIELRNKDNC